MRKIQYTIHLEDQDPISPDHFRVNSLDKAIGEVIARDSAYPWRISTILIAEEVVLTETLNEAQDEYDARYDHTAGGGVRI